MNTDIERNMGLGDISNLHFGGQESAVASYLDSLLFGELDEFLKKNNMKVFKGISREFTKKYIGGFNSMLKLNEYTVDAMDKAFVIEYNGKEAYEYFGFFVFQTGRGNAFGSFPSAYKFANEIYMFNHMVLGNATVQLAQNTQVSFGHVIVQDGGMVEKDLEQVVNNDFYKALVS